MASKKKLPLPTLLVTCDNEWEHMAEVKGKKAARAWMLTHAKGGVTFENDNPNWKDCKSKNFRVWELLGSAAAIIRVTEQIDLTVEPTQDEE